MINGKKVLVVIAARGGSKGLPGKNIRDLCGKPLIGWSIEAALNSKYADRVVVTTDDEVIAEVARSEGADVPFLRPAKFATDQSPSSGAILHAIDFCEVEGKYEYVVLLEPTSPLTESQDVDRALEILSASDSLAIVGIADVEDCHPEFCVQKSKNGKITKYGEANFSMPKRRQDLETIYAFDGSLYISDIDTYKKYQTFYHENTIGYVSEPWKKYEIDTLMDFLVVEVMMKNKNLLRDA
ncbi:acylneuraminate cytidylyltransferase [Vibrio lentus]|uniref:acylneuraminate cytidylyltransferase family protein n=1 Tax=Vibrio lentus TaxID=136468 RepID=UPI000C834FF3|nr:acylneuraminate cytidylyltransferase family protein [Vibrio lentus]PMH28899.1 acylneuraminate cytidylyltransferase [Vibrio lentus]PMK68438.1 acylneuraminate cytidylyltransferase [Vibrio lentus]